MDKVYIAVLAVLCILQIFTLKSFLKAEIPSPNKKSLFRKMICSAIFVAVAVICMLYAGNYSKFAILMLLGLFFGLLGDLFLHIVSKEIYFVIGLLSFAAAHILYVSAYSVAMNEYFPGNPFFSLSDLIMYIIIIFTGLCFMHYSDLHLGRAYPFIIFYTCVIGVMIVKAGSLATHIFGQGDSPLTPAAGIVLLAGALLFAFSDGTLSILLFKKDVEKHGALRYANIYSYFYGQMLLAMTILFIK